MTEITIYSVHKAIIAKVGKQELRFLCCTYRLMVFKIVNDENISNSFELPSRYEYMTKTIIYTV